MVVPLGPLPRPVQDGIESTSEREVATAPGGHISTLTPAAPPAGLSPAGTSPAGISIDDHYVAVVAHELQQPLAPMTVALRMLAESGSLDDRDRAIMDILERQTSRLRRLVSDLLDMTRFRRGKLRIQPRSTDLPEIIAQVIQEVQGSFRNAVITLHTGTIAPDLRVWADSARLTQVLLNLLDNARKFTPVGGMVTIAAIRDGDTAVMTVSDTGEGIVDSDLPHVFELFRQSDNGRAGGLGIGLAVVKEIVDLHGGTIAVDSAGKGRGTSFTIRLPLL